MGIGRRARLRTMSMAGAVGLLGALLAQVAVAPAAFAAPGGISTIAGTGAALYTGDGGPATAATLNGPQGMDIDHAGNMFIADANNNVIRKIDTSGKISTVAGTGTGGYGGDGGAATAALLNGPDGVTVDASDNLYISDTGNNVIRKVDTTGKITTIAGTGAQGFGGDGGAATSAQLASPVQVLLAGSGYYIADYNNHVVRKVDGSGNISTVAGNGSFAYSGDGGPATSASIGKPVSLAFDGAGNLIVADVWFANIRLVNASTQIISTIVGTGTGGYSGDGGLATNAQIQYPNYMQWRAGSLYFADAGNNVIRQVNPRGIITTIAGTGAAGFSGDGGPATSAQLNTPSGLAFTPTGDLIITDEGNNRLRKIQGLGPDLLDLTATAPPAIVAGAGYAYRLTLTNDGTVGGATNVVVTDHLPAGVTYVGATSTQGACSLGGSTVTCAVGAVPANSFDLLEIDVKAPPTPQTLSNTVSVAAHETDPDTADNSVSTSTSVVNGANAIYPFAGNGLPGYSGDGGPATSALLNTPTRVRTDSAGNIYFTDAGNHVVRRVDTLGTVTTIAGNGTAGNTGDGGPATAAELSDPEGLAIDGAGDVFIADSGNTDIRKVDPSGIITTVPFAPGTAIVYEIDGVAVDSAGNLYISDINFARIYKVQAGSGVVTIFRGGLRTPGSQCPRGMFVDGSNNLYVAMTCGGGVWKFNTTTGASTVVAGRSSGDGPPSGDGGPATQAVFGAPIDVTADSAGRLYIADGTTQYSSFSDNAIRVVETNGIISTIAGGPAPGYSGDGGPAKAALLNSPDSAVGLPQGGVVIADAGNNALRIVTGSGDLVALAAGSPLTVGAGGAYSYQLQVKNDGSVGDAPGVVLSDTLPAGVSFVGATASQGSCMQANGTVMCNLGTVAAVTSASVTINVTAPHRSAKVVNTASVTSTAADPVTADNTASATTYVAPADLAVSVAATPNSGADVGAPLTITATVTNRGPNTATGVKLTDVLPAGLTVLSATVAQGACTASNGTYTCALGALAAGASTALTVKAKPTAAGVATDKASVSAAQADPYAFNKTATLSTFISGAGCGETIVRSVNLAADIGPCAGTGVVIGADHIMVNLNGHKIFGRGTGSFSLFDDLVGVALPNRTGVTLTGGTVSGFDTGIFVNSGLTNKITGMTVTDNIGLDASFGPVYPDLGDGILIEDAAYDQITNNTLIHNGSYDGVGLFGLDTNANLIQGNTIENTVSSRSGSDGEGVIINNFLATFDYRRGESLRYNDVIGNYISGNAASGISNVSNANAKIENNTVIGNGLTAFPANGIGDQVGKQATSTVDDIISGNHVTGNGDDGIEILLPLNGDKVTGNFVASNNVNKDGSFNLEDTNGNCTSNAWSNNTSQNGTVSPGCLLPGGAAMSTAQVSPVAAAASDPPIPQYHRRLPPRAK